MLPLILPKSHRRAAFAVCLIIAATGVASTSYALDPVASATATDVTAAGATSYSFTVKYSDDGPIQDNFSNNDVRVTGPGGFDVPGKFVSESSNFDGSRITVTYSITPPGGSWDSADNGTYTVVMQPNQVFDTPGNAVHPGPIGTFNVSVPGPPATGTVGNISTRLPIGTGENVLIEGFIVQGSAGSAKNVIVRAIGPSLTAFGIADALANPTLEIHDSGGAVIARNDDWKITQIGGVITADQATAISATGVAPTNELESAIIASLLPGSYTAVVRGSGNSTGTGVVDAYDLSSSSPARLANISTRGLVQPGDKLLIGGFIVQNGPVRVVIRATGPSLIAFGISNALPDTTLELHDQNGALLLQNDDWKSSQQQELINTGLQPSHDLEAALVTTIQPGQYTAQVRGKNNASGIGVVEVYFLQ